MIEVMNILMIIIMFFLAIAVGTLVYHLITPMGMHWLTEDDLDKLSRATLIFSIVVFAYESYTGR